jgi:hypothetical protein
VATLAQSVWLVWRVLPVESLFMFVRLAD